MSKPIKAKDILVWNVLEGPILAEDMPEEERPDHPSYVAHLVLGVTTKMRPTIMFEYELWFDSFKEAYEYKQKVDKCMEAVGISEVLTQ
jgi:hypothetical protein